MSEVQHDIDRIGDELRVAIERLRHVRRLLDGPPDCIITEQTSLLWIPIYPDQRVDAHTSLGEAAIPFLREAETRAVDEIRSLSEVLSFKLDVLTATREPQ